VYLTINRITIVTFVDSSILYREMVIEIELFSYDRERIGKLIVTSKPQNNYFLLFLSGITCTN